MSTMIALEQRWSSFRKLVASDYPYCTMYGVHVLDGAVVACESIQRSVSFLSTENAGSDPEPSADACWRALEGMCARLGSGRLAELRFQRGKPVNARTAEGGRRFRRLLAVERSLSGRAPAVS